MGPLLLLLLLVWFSSSCFSSLLLLLRVISIFLRGLCNARGDVKDQKKARGEEEEEEEEEKKDGYLRERKRGEQFREKRGLPSFSCCCWNCYMAVGHKKFLESRHRLASLTGFFFSPQIVQRRLSHILLKRDEKSLFWKDLTVHHDIFLS